MKRAAEAIYLGLCAALFIGGMAMWIAKPCECAPETLPAAFEGEPMLEVEERLKAAEEALRAARAALDGH